jgi:hypothetical protein
MCMSKQLESLRQDEYGQSQRRSVVIGKGPYLLLSPLVHQVDISDGFVNLAHDTFKVVFQPRRGHDFPQVTRLVG